MHACIHLQSFGALGAALGAPCAWPVSEWFGRKPALILGGVPGVIGWLMITYAHYIPSESGFLAVLLLGRILTGFQVGWSVFCVSVSKINTVDREIFARKNSRLLNFRVVLFSSPQLTGSVASFLYIIRC